MSDSGKTKLKFFNDFLLNFDICNREFLAVVGVVTENKQCFIQHTEAKKEQHKKTQVLALLPCHIAFGWFFSVVGKEGARIPGDIQLSMKNNKHV